MLCAHDRCSGQSAVFIASTAELVKGTDLTESSKCSTLEKPQKVGGVMLWVGGFFGFVCLFDWFLFWWGFLFAAFFWCVFVYWLGFCLINI